jgi:hypothetical protein
MRRDKNAGHGPPSKTNPWHPEHVAHRANRIISFFVMIVYDLFLRSPVMGYRKGRLI